LLAKWGFVDGRDVVGGRRWGFRDCCTKRQGKKKNESKVLIGNTGRFVDEGFDGQRLLQATQKWVNIGWRPQISLVIKDG
jgi:hypothetical protein